MSALWSPADLLAATGGLMRAPFAAKGISIDTRTLRPGDLFVALLGEHSDGHAHVAAALAQGAAGAMVHALPDHLADRAPLLQVADTLAGLRALAAFGRARLAGRLIAVTGSVGKTTTKEMLRTILSAQGKTWAAEASHNNHWGVPLTLARMPPRAQFAVAEIGMNHAGEIYPLASLARPHVAVITTIAAAHIGHLGSLEAIADEKASLLRALEPGGVAILPADSALLPRLLAAAGDHRVVTFGTSPQADARLLAAEGDADGSTVRAALDGREIGFRLNVPGRHMALNALAALAGALALGADLDAAAASLAAFAPVAGRGVRRTLPLAGGGEAILLDESYNASSASVRAALAVLAMQPATRRVAVLGDMRELGEFGPAEHAGLAPDAADNADIVFTCGPLMAALSTALPARQRGGHAPDAAALAPLVAAALRPGDAVLVKGSLGSRMKLIVEALDAASVAVLETR